MKTAVEARTIGVNFNTQKEAEVRLWAPLLNSVELVLPKKAERLLMEKDDFGYWHKTTAKLQPGDLYTFSLNNEKELPDPASLSQPEGVHGASQAIDIKSYPWQDKNWKNLPLEDYIIYELHTGTFSPAGDFKSIISRLDYLKELGVNAIEIMPVAQFPGNRNWGYDGVFPFAVQNSYGGAKALQELVNACHQKELAVILDVVYNHLGPEGNYFGEYAPYFTNKYNTPWGPAINFDDAYCDGVRQYFIENVLMWFRDFHIDALRLDAVHAIKDFSPTHILKEIKQQVDELMKATGRTHYLIVELDLNDPKFINPLEDCGYGMDAQWIDEFHHALRVTSGEGRQGYYEDFNGIQHLAKAYTNAYVYDGVYSPHRKKTFGAKADNNLGKQFIVFSQNHDHVGNRMLGERTSKLVSFEMQKLLAGAVMVSPYIPMLFMGEEWGETNPFLYFVSHTDPDLAQAVREGRKKEFAAFHAASEALDPMSEESFQQSKLQWEVLQKEPHQTLFRYYQQLLCLRKTQPALKTLDRKTVEVSYTKEKQTLLLLRSHPKQLLYCCMNFSKEVQEIYLPKTAAHCQLLINSAHPQWSAPGTKRTPEKKHFTFVPIQPESLVIYASEIFE